MYNILIIEDEMMVLDVLRAYLEKEGYQVFTATTGEEGLKIFSNENLHLVLLDLMLPDISGEEICQQIRRKSDIHIFMLTAKGSLEHRIEGLNLGADEYLVKPFSPRELVARVGALFRRLPPSPSYLFDDGRLQVDAARRIIKVNSEIISFTTTEFNILCDLIEQQGRVLTRDQLINKNLGEDFEGYDRTIDVHIKNIRKKIEKDTKAPQYIITVLKVGYKFGGRLS